MRRTSVVALAAVITLVPAGSAEAAFTVRGSVNQVQVTGAKPGSLLRLANRQGKRVAVQRAGRLGGAVFRGVKAGNGYRLRGRRFTVLPNRSRPPSTKLYDQKIPTGGYGYLRTRDGTKLAIDVRLPSGPGPYPTLFEYAGYGYADPAGAQAGISPVANLLGYAVVDVNIRGTGCSGGAFDFFEPLQGLDGYDVIETIARQPWVLHHKVGMIGVSYGGISQLFVGATRPPSLAAITPLSVIDNTQTTLYPGGVLNTGFTLNWAKARDADAKPATATTGQPWAFRRITSGDKTCKANQALHPAAVNQVRKARRNHYYVKRVADPLAPVTFVHKIKVPTYLACQWTDEQTGAHCPTLASRFSGTSRKWFTFTNGVHPDSLDPASFNRWYDFLEIYVAQRPPNLSPGVRALAPTVFQALVGVPGVTLPPDPIQGKPTLAAAKAAFEALPPVRILFDNGAGGSQPGQPYPGFEHSFARWPLPGTHAASWYLAPGGALASSKPTTSGSDAFTWNSGARPGTDFTGDTRAGGLWGAGPAYNWTQNPAGTSLSYVSAPLTANTVVVGGGALYAWVRTRAGDLDLQATVTEVRPDGKETFVQSGWLRGSLRKLDRHKRTLLEPVLSLRARDAARLPKGKWAKVAIPLYYQGHAYRAGSRIRVIVSAVGGDQPVWAFAEPRPKSGHPKVSVARAPARASRLVLPVVSGVDVPTGLPPCPGLRGEPCRTYTGG
jgi:predicted acyl esterase